MRCRLARAISRSPEPSGSCGSSAAIRWCGANSSARVRQNNPRKVHTRIFVAFVSRPYASGAFWRRSGAEGGEPHRLRLERRGRGRMTCARWRRREAQRRTTGPAAAMPPGQQARLRCVQELRDRLRVPLRRDAQMQPAAHRGLLGLGAEWDWTITRIMIISGSLTRMQARYGLKYLWRLGPTHESAPGLRRLRLCSARGDNRIVEMCRV